MILALPKLPLPTGGWQRIGSLILLLWMMEIQKTRRREQCAEVPADIFSTPTGRSL